MVIDFSSHLFHLPPISDNQGQPHRKGMILQQPPVCGRCSDSPSSIAKLEQHANVLKKPSRAGKTSKLDLGELFRPCFSRATFQQRVQFRDQRPFEKHKYTKRVYPHGCPSFLHVNTRMCTHRSTRYCNEDRPFHISRLLETVHAP